MSFSGNGNHHEAKINSMNGSRRDDRRSMFSPVTSSSDTVLNFVTNAATRGIPTLSHPAPARRNRSNLSQPKKPPSSRSLIIVILMIIAGFFSVGIFVMMQNLPTHSSFHSSLTDHNAFSLASSENNYIDHDGFKNDVGINERKLHDQPSNNSKLSYLPPLTEEEEQNILQAAHEELNRFPISIGRDSESDSDNGKKNDGWETILHPGIEALKFLHGDSSVSEEKVQQQKKRASVAEIAGLLSGKKLRGARNEPNEGMIGNHDRNSNGINDGNGSDNIVTGSSQSGLDEGYMRVPKFWDPAPFRLIADERERRSGGSDNNSLPRDGVRRYLGNYGSRLMTSNEAKSIGSRVPSKSNDGKLLETIFIAIASYRDYQCSSTVESAFFRASHPERIRVAVVDQIRLGEDDPCSLPPEGPCEKAPHQAMCLYASQIDYLTIDAGLAVGPVFARHLGSLLFRTCHLFGLHLPYSCSCERPGPLFVSIFKSLRSHRSPSLSR